MPDDSLSLAEGALAPWSGARSEYFTGLLVGVAEFGGFAFDAPWKSLKAKDKKLVLYGTGSRSVHVTYKNRYDRKRSYDTIYEGIVPWLQRRHGESESDWSREQIEELHARGALPRVRAAPGSSPSRWPSPWAAATSSSCAACPSPTRSRRWPRSS